jgi:predicted Fe-Mo cluster-binding NifX family protein
MKAAFTTWNNRIAPVFDVSRMAWIVTADSGSVIDKRRDFFKEDLPAGKVLRLVEWGVGTLVCGAISFSMQSILIAQGIRVIPFVAGELDEVIDAWLNGRIESEFFAMPGCRRRRRRNRVGGFK